MVFRSRNTKAILKKIESNLITIRFKLLVFANFLNILMKRFKVLLTNRTLNLSKILLPMGN